MLFDQNEYLYGALDRGHRDQSRLDALSVDALTFSLELLASCLPGDALEPVLRRRKLHVGSLCNLCHAGKRPGRHQKEQLPVRR